MTGGVAFLLYTDVFASDSKTSHFNRAVDQVRADSRVRELLGPAKQIRAFGEPTRNKWALARPIASNISKDRTGTEHLVMHFNVEGPLNSGVVHMHMTKSPSQSEYQYKYLALDVKGHSRIYLEKADAAKEQKKTGMKMFGVRWG
ncbi:Mitochondrial import inner membrane translocase subunit Tim21 [Lasallia pustulata]|nr:Mitochondrial import inner membrane translocase subunit Tim21 [Lasallia pustulata]